MLVKGDSNSWILVCAGTAGSIGLLCNQQSLGSGWRSFQGKRIFFLLPYVMLQSAQWGYLDLCQLNNWCKFRLNHFSSGWGLGCGRDLLHPLPGHLKSMVRHSLPCLCKWKYENSNPLIIDKPFLSSYLNLAKECSPAFLGYINSSLPCGWNSLMLAQSHRWSHRKTKDFHTVKTVNKQ